jgi:hypothetical protein
MNFIVNRHPNELWGKCKKDPEWFDETHPGGGPTGRIYNQCGQYMKRVNGKWQTVKP